jgi:hypothetical protein
VATTVKVFCQCRRSTGEDDAEDAMTLDPSFIVKEDTVPTLQGHNTRQQQKADELQAVKDEKSNEIANA